MGEPGGPRVQEHHPHPEGKNWSLPAIYKVRQSSIFSHKLLAHCQECSFSVAAPLESAVTKKVKPLNVFWRLLTIHTFMLTPAGSTKDGSLSS